MPSFCNKCGTALAPDARFCEECGAQISGKAPSGIAHPKRMPILVGLALAVVLGLGALFLFVGDPSNITKEEGERKKPNMPRGVPELVKQETEDPWKTETVKQCTKLLEEDQELMACGEEWYQPAKLIAPHRLKLIQAKGNFTFSVKPLTEADRLNQIQWNASVCFKPSVYREYREWVEGNMWGPWSDGSGEITLRCCSAIVKGGQLTVSREWIRQERYPFSCSAIPLAGPSPQTDALRPNQQLRSVEASASAVLEVKNNSGKAVRVLWVDYAGKEVFYRELQPGESYIQQTFLTHPCRIRERDAGKLLQEMTVTQPNEVVSID